MHSANHPGNGMALRTTALRVTCNNMWHAARQCNSRQRGTKTDFETGMGPEHELSMKFLIFKIFDLMHEPHGECQRRRYKFIFRFGDGNRKPRLTGVNTGKKPRGEMNLQISSNSTSNTFRA